MKGRYDVVVIGAGPVGSYTAYQLADKGFKVCLLDEKENIGESVLCAGVIGKAAFKRYDLPSESIVARVDSVSFFSPFGQRLVYEPQDIFAYVVDRDVFDRKLFLQAKRCGVDIFLKQRVLDITGASYFYSVKTSGKEFNTKAVVIATGVDYQLQSKVGLGNLPYYLYGSQIELPVPSARDKIEIHIGKDFAPGSFGWVIPYGEKTSKIGVILAQKGKTWLRKFVEQRLGESSKFETKDIGIKPIAYGTIEKSTNGCILAVGEAAGQVKTTTGGGIFYGLLCSEIAVDKLTRTLRNGHSLSDYEITWRSALVSELDIGMNLRTIASKLGDQDIENLFSFVKQNKFWVELLVPRINFDYHSNFIFYCLKSFGQLLGLKNK
ncbi:MAG: geranylgeranyl reductase family protein [bacterium]